MTETLPIPRDSCWLIQKSPPVYILLGRYGDLIQISPLWKAIHNRTGMKPVVIVSTDYANVFDGMSYVQPHPIAAHWWKGIPAAKRLAQDKYGGGTVVQFWQEPPKHDDTIGFNGKTWTTLQSHGQEHGVNLALDPNYGTSMARRCGFSQQEWLKLPVIFDRRNPEREEALVKNLISRRKPTVLYNFAGISSPFAHTAEVLAELRAFDFHLVNLGEIRAGRIFDLLGLMDKAVGMVTIDTATMHLAPASNVRYVAYLVDGWCTSMPKGNVALEIKYSKAREQMPLLREVLKSWAGK